MSVRMVADFRRKPSLARRKAAKEQKRLHQERKAIEAWNREILFGIDFGVVEPDVIEIRRNWWT